MSNVEDIQKAEDPKKEEDLQNDKDPLKAEEKRLAESMQEFEKLKKEIEDDKANFIEEMQEQFQVAMEYGEEFIYNRNTGGNKFMMRVFIILLLMYGATAACHHLIVKGWPKQKSNEANYSDYVVMILCSITVIVLINYFWICSYWGRKIPYNFLALILAILALSFFFAGFTILLSINNFFTSVFLGLSVGVVICFFLALINCSLTSWLIYPVVIFSASAALVGAKYKKLLPNFSMLPYELSVLIFILLTLVMELRLILDTSNYVDIYNKDYSFAAWLLFVSPFTVFIKCIQMYGIIAE